MNFALRENDFESAASSSKRNFQYPKRSFKQNDLERENDDNRGASFRHAIRQFFLFYDGRKSAGMRERAMA